VARGGIGKSGLDGGDGWLTIGLAVVVAVIASFAIRGMAARCRRV